MLDVVIAQTNKFDKPIGVYVVKIHQSVGRYSGAWEIQTVVIETNNYSDALLWRDNIRLALGIG